MHFDDERVQRLLHGELGGEQGAALAHLESCGACRTLVADARREEEWIHGLLPRLDHELPRRRARIPRWAAGVLLALLAAGAASAVPGSPVRDWIRKIAPSRSEVPAPQPEAFGIAIDPGERLIIVFEGPVRRERVRVRRTDGSRVIVRALGGRARFSSDVDRLLVTTPDSSVAFEIEVPRGARGVEIRVGSLKLVP